MNCKFCKKELNLDSATLCVVEFPNVGKFATTIERLELIEEIKKAMFCSSQCQILYDLSIMSGENSPFSDEISRLSSTLALMLIVESTSPEFIAKVKKLQKI